MNNHNTHYATTDDLELLRSRVIRDIKEHPLGSSSFYLSEQETRGYRQALFGVLGAIDALLGRSSF